MPRVGFPGGPRLEWYDRNAVQQALGYTATGVAPHAATIRATYTVPAGKKALVGSIHGDVYRDTTPTTAGLALINFGFIGQPLLFVSHNSATVGSPQRGGVTVNGLLLTGETINLQTADFSTAGTMRYNGAAAILEFDA